MPRTYTRKFDWEEAQRRHEDGESYTSLALDYGVSKAAVRLACDDEARRKMAEHSAIWQRSGSCPDCGAQTTHRSEGDARCRSCHAKTRAISVRDLELQCITCREWKPDQDFARNVAEPARRGRHTQCRGCSTISRREHRQRNREADNAYSRAYKRRKRWEQMTPLQRATSRDGPP